jgi:hypothetical protein
MPDKDPANWSSATWALALLMPLGGGFINWYARVKTGHTRAFNILELLGEVFTSGFVGLWVFMLLASYDQPAGLCAAASGVSGHMATRLLFLIERAAEQKFGKMIGEDK